MIGPELLFYLNIFNLLSSELSVWKTKFFARIIFNLNGRPLIWCSEYIFCDERLFSAEIVSHLAYDLNIGQQWPMRNVIQKSSSFLKRRQLAVQHFMSIWQDNSANLWWFPCCSGPNFCIKTIYYFCFIIK